MRNEESKWHVMLTRSPSCCGTPKKRKERIERLESRINKKRGVPPLSMRCDSITRLELLAERA